MAVPAKKPKYTYEDYLQTPDDERYQLIAGDLIREPAPKTRHQRISGELFACLHAYAKKNKTGTVFIAPTDVHFDNENVFEPDILFISKDRLAIITENNIKGAPDLVVEVLSPSSGYYDLVKKKKLYASFGVKEYWIVDPIERTVEIHILRKDRNLKDKSIKGKNVDDENVFEISASLAETDMLTSEMFPGLSIDLEDVFK